MKFSAILGMSGQCGLGFLPEPVHKVLPGTVHKVM
jgi:hypothetical protein